MKNADWPSRLFDAALAAFFGALPGLLCFWLYGLRMSHALLLRAADSVGMLISALRDIERLRLPGGRSGLGWTLLALAVWTGAL